MGAVAATGSQTSFLNDAARGSMAEIEMARLALKNSSDPAIKAFAQRLVNDHTAANRDLMSLAAKKEVTLPAEMNNREKAAVQKLSALTGAAFNTEFIQQMVKDHEIAVALYRRASVMNTDADVKEFAAKALPDLEAHLQTARSMNKTPATIKSNSNKTFKPTLGSVPANTTPITITNSSNMPGHPNNPNSNSYRSSNANVNANAAGNMNR
jgi:putative membrane protein